MKFQPQFLNNKEETDYEEIENVFFQNENLLSNQTGQEMEETKKSFQDDSNCVFEKYEQTLEKKNSQEILIETEEKHLIFVIIP
jgi:hypothetical protein